MAKPKIVGEATYTRDLRKPPSEIVFAHEPGRDQDERIREFLAKRYGDAELPTEAVEGEEDEAVEAGVQQVLDVFFEASVFDAMFQQCVEAAHERLETLGLMIGKQYEWDGVPHVLVDRIATAGLDATAVSVRFDRDAFEELFDALDDLEDGYLIAGWYHSHPGYTSFMSATDVKTQRRMFPDPLSTALVIDPVNLDCKAFRVDGEDCVEVPYAVHLAAAAEKAVWMQLECQTCVEPVKAPVEDGTASCPKCGAQGAVVPFEERSRVT